MRDNGKVAAVLLEDVMKTAVVWTVEENVFQVSVWAVMPGK